MQIEASDITPIDWTKPIETIDGYPARVISTDYRDGCLTLVVVQAELEKISIILRFLKDGTKMYHGTGIRNRKTKREEGWVVIFPDRWAGMIWRSKEEAQRHGDTKHAIDIVKIEWEE
jgi:hypothetical protein